MSLGLLLLAVGCEAKQDEHTPAADEEEAFWRLRFSLKPMLERQDSLQPEWVHRPFMAGLAITYVIDRVGSIERVTTKHLELWGISAERLHEESIASFTAPFLTEEGELHWRTYSGPDQTPVLAAPSLESTFASSLVLSPAFQASVEWLFQGWEGLWIALPSRSSCRVLRPTDAATLRKLRAEFLRDHQSSRHPLLDRFLETTAGGGFAPGARFTDD